MTPTQPSTGNRDWFTRHLRTPAQIKESPSAPWLLEGIIAPSSLGLLWGLWGTYKTFLTLAWSAHIGAGHDWLGRQTMQARVLYVMGEGTAGLGARLDAIERGHTLWDVPGVDFFSGRIDLRDKEQIDALRDNVVERGYGLVWFDTLARMMPGADENSAKDVGGIIEALDSIRDATGASIWATHHSTKEGTSPRGISAYQGACDSEFKVSLRKAGGVVLKCEQQRDAALIEPITLFPQPTGESLVLVGATERKITTDTTDLKLLGALADLGGEATATEWQKHCQGDVKVSTFYRYLEKLVTSGFASIPGRGRGNLYTLTEQGRRSIERSTKRSLPVTPTHLRDTESITTTAPPPLGGDSEMPCGCGEGDMHAHADDGPLQNSEVPSEWSPYEGPADFEDEYVNGWVGSSEQGAHAP